MKIHTTHTHSTTDAIGHEMAHDCVCGPDMQHISIRADGDIERTFVHHSLKTWWLDVHQNNEGEA